MESLFASSRRVTGRLLIAAAYLAVIDVAAVYGLVLRNTQSSGGFVIAIARDLLWCFAGLAAAAVLIALGVVLGIRFVPLLRRLGEAQLTTFGAVAMAAPLGFVGLHHYLAARVIGGPERLGWLVVFACLVALVAGVSLIRKPKRTQRRILGDPGLAASAVALLPLYLNASVEVVSWPDEPNQAAVIDVQVPSASKRPDAIVLVTLDTTRFDAVGYSGSGRTHTPVLDRLAAEGSSFLQATTPTPVTLPSHTSMFTGLLPRQHGVTYNGLRLPHDLPLLTQQLQGAGWRTAAFVSAAVLDGRTGLSRGFETYDDLTSGRWHPAPQLTWVRIAKRAGLIRYTHTRSAETVTAGALAWIERDDPRPAFLWVHYFSAHFPYEPDVRPDDIDDARIELLTAEERQRFERGDGTPAWFVDAMRKLYEREVEEVDIQLGLLIKGLERRGWHDSSLLIALADHGESFEAPSVFDHADVLTESTIHIPLIVRWPGVIAAGSKPDVLASVKDVHATILEAAGLGGARVATSHSLLHATTRTSASNTRTYTVHDSYPHPMGSSGEKLIAVRTRVSKLLSAPDSGRISFYHLDDAAGEARDRIDDTDRKATIARLSAALDPDERPSYSAEAIEDEQTIDMLNSLGYVE